MAGRAENHAGAVRDAAGGVGGQIVAAQVGLSLHNHARGGAVNQDFAEQAACDLDGRAHIEGPGENPAGLNAALHSTMLIAKCDCSRDWTFRSG